LPHELDRFREAAASGDPLIVACTQEAPLFSEIAAAHESSADIRYTNIRETAGWSADAAKASAKMAALIAAAAEAAPEIPFVKLTSEGVTLVYGRDEQTIEAANLLKQHLDVTVLIKHPLLCSRQCHRLSSGEGEIRSAKGHLGAFELTVDKFGQAAPSSRGVLMFGPNKDGAVSHCDIVLDISGDAPLFPAADLRDGYLRADPRNPAAVLKAVLKARDLVGTFDKPRYVTFAEDLCAIRALRSSAAIGASTSARPARSRRRGITS